MATRTWVDGAAGGTPITAAALNAIEAAIDAAATTGPVLSVAGRTGAVSLTKTDVGLSNVTNVAQAAASTTITAGTGLTGGGSLAANRTLTVNAAAAGERDAAKVLMSSDGRVPYISSGTTADRAAALAAAPATASIILIPVA